MEVLTEHHKKIMRGVQAATVNQEQCRQLSRHTSRIYGVLTRMQRPEPTRQLLVVFAACENLICRGCQLPIPSADDILPTASAAGDESSFNNRHDTASPALLPSTALLQLSDVVHMDNFLKATSAAAVARLARSLSLHYAFESVHRRLTKVWSLHPMPWDRMAAAKDAASLCLRLFGDLPSEPTTASSDSTVASRIAQERLSLLRMTVGGLWKVLPHRLEPTYVVMPPFLREEGEKEERRQQHNEPLYIVDPQQRFAHHEEKRRPHHVASAGREDHHMQGAHDDAQWRALHLTNGRGRQTTKKEKEKEELAPFCPMTVEPAPLEDEHPAAVMGREEEEGSNPIEMSERKPPPEAAATPSSTSSSSSSFFASPPPPPLRCFQTDAQRYRLYGVPVVVRRLAESDFTSSFVPPASSPAERRNDEDSFISDLSMESFVLDIARRCTWCSPCLVPTLGGFCEVERSDGSGGRWVEKCLGAVVQDVIAEGRVVVGVQQQEEDDRTSPENVTTQWTMTVEELLFPSIVPTPTPHEVELDAQRQQHAGSGVTLTEAITIARRVADALLYILMDVDEVHEESVRRWLWVSASNVYVTFALDRSEPTKKKEGPENENEEVEERYRKIISVQYEPPFFVENGALSRWMPHVHAKDAACYAVTQLLVSMLSRSVPHPLVSDQASLALLLAPPQGSSRAVGPVGCELPRYVPSSVRRVCEWGLQLTHAVGTPHQTATNTTAIMSKFADPFELGSSSTMSASRSTTTTARGPRRGSTEAPPPLPPLCLEAWIGQLEDLQAHQLPIELADQLLWQQDRLRARDSAGLHWSSFGPAAAAAENREPASLGSSILMENPLLFQQQQQQLSLSRSLHRSMPTGDYGVASSTTIQQQNAHNRTSSFAV